MKPNNFAFCIFPLFADRCPLTAIFCLLIAVCCKLSAVRNLFHATHHCTSITPALGGPGNSLKCGLNPYIPNEPNFKTPRLTVTLDMLRTYNENCPKNRKKNEPKTHQK